jgi:hypothetical protein
MATSCATGVQHRSWTRGASQSRSTAKRLRSPSEQKLKAPSCVARKTTRGARPARRASCHRGAHRHQRSPGFSPAKPNSGTGVERSLPQDFEYSRNPAVMTLHTVWLPMSSRLVSQQPSRKKPVIGLNEQTSSRSPSTFLGSLRRPPPPLPASSLNIGILCIIDPSPASRMFRLGLSSRRGLDSYNGSIPRVPTARLHEQPRCCPASNRCRCTAAGAQLSERFGSDPCKVR